ISQLVRKEGLGFVLSHGSMEELRHAVDRLRQPEEMAAMRARCRQYYLDNLKLSKELVKYRDFYLRLVKTGQSS
ncbi:MAG: hypothetical protein KAV87_65895, partial [Desulfobacteraceae bacterium]|nr:hypothetical protein [Desulfobacteraceae bacterium]